MQELGTFVSPQRFAAIEAIPSRDGRWKCGTLTHIAPETGIHFCGDGFSPKTVLVQSGERHYFVLRTALENKLFRAQSPRHF